MHSDFRNSFVGHAGRMRQRKALCSSLERLRVRRVRMNFSNCVSVWRRDCTAGQKGRSTCENRWRSSIRGTQDEDADSRPQGTVQTGPDPEGGEQAGQHWSKIRSDSQQGDVPPDDAVAPCGIGAAHDHGAQTDADPTHDSRMGQISVTCRPEQTKDQEVHNKDDQGGVPGRLTRPRVRLEYAAQDSVPQKARR